MPASDSAYAFDIGGRAGVAMVSADPYETSYHGLSVLYASAPEWIGVGGTRTVRAKTARTGRSRRHRRSPASIRLRRSGVSVERAGPVEAAGS